MKNLVSLSSTYLQAKNYRWIIKNIENRPTLLLKSVLEKLANVCEICKSNGIFVSTKNKTTKFFSSWPIVTRGIWNVINECITVSYEHLSAHSVLRRNLQSLILNYTF